jgi:TolB-like protein/Tfp pilus assembly protein PilF
MNILKELQRRNVIRAGLAYTLAVWFLLQIVDFVLEVIAAPDWILQVFVLAGVIGLPIVLIFSWVFEMTPDGIKKESDLDRSESVTPQTGRKLDRVIIVMLTLVVMALLADKFLLGGPDPTPAHIQTENPAGISRPAADTSQAQIAAPRSLPFVNMSSDPNQEFFSDGISEEILNALTHIPDLKVAARTSSFQFKGQNPDIREVGRKLGVALLLEGSVRTAGEQVRITAQLIQVSDGFHLWSRTFDRKLEDVFEIQDEIARSIADELEATFTGRNVPRQTEVDLVAYQHYLKARSLVPKRTRASLKQAISELEAALEIEPGYVPAMALMATTYLVLPWYSSMLPVGEARELGREWAERALAIEADNEEALAALGSIVYQSDLNWTESRRLLERAVELAPANASVNNFLGDYFLRVGDIEKAFYYESRALKLDPLSPVQFTDLANVYAMMGDLERISELSAQVRALDPAFIRVMNVEFDAYALAGDLERAGQILEYTLAQPSIPAIEKQYLQIKYHYENGETEQAEALFAETTKAFERGETNASHQAFNAAWRGDFDTAAAMMQHAVDQDDGIWLFPLVIRLPEQAADNAAWQAFWSQPAVAELARIRRGHGIKADPRQRAE